MSTATILRMDMLKTRALGRSTPFGSYLVAEFLVREEKADKNIHGASIKGLPPDYDPKAGPRPGKIAMGNTHRILYCLQRLTYSRPSPRQRRAAQAQS